MAHDDSTQLEELFSQAAERMAAGEPLEEIFASIPNEHFDELSDMLAVVEATLQLREMPVPQPSAVRRAEQRAAFHALAAEKRSELLGAAQAAPQTAAAGGRRAGATALWEQVQTLFTIRRLRLAPLLILLLAVYTGASTLVATAEVALPGDLTYPLKQWIRSQRVWLAPDEVRDERVQELNQEAAADVARAAARADLNDLVVNATTYGTVQKIDHIRYKVGELWVAPHYTPDANSAESLPMQLIGTPEVGAFVRLDYQILPGQTSAGSEAMVLGVSLTVLAPPPTATPRPIVEAIVADETPTPTPTPTPACIPQPPARWRQHQVQPSDDLVSLAEARGASVERVREVNCLPNDAVITGDMLYLPPVSSPRPTATPSEGEGSELPPPTAMRMTPTVTPVATDDGGAGQEPTAEPTATTEEAEATSTPEPGTPEPEATATFEPVATITATPATAEPVTTEPITAEPAVTVAPTLDPDATATADPTPSETVTAEPATATPDVGAATPTEEPGAPTPEVTPTSDDGTPVTDEPPTAAPTSQADTPTPNATATTAPDTGPTTAPTVEPPSPTATLPPATNTPASVGGDTPDARPPATEPARATEPSRPTEPPSRPTEPPPRPTEPPPTEPPSAPTEPPAPTTDASGTGGVEPPDTGDAPGSEPAGDATPAP